MKSEFILAHLPVKITQHVDINIENLIKEDQDYVTIEFNQNNIILRKTAEDNYLFRVRQYRHKENKDIIINKLEPIQKFTSIHSSYKILQDFHFEPTISDQSLVEHLSLKPKNQNYSDEDLKSCRVPPSLLKHYYMKIPHLKLVDQKVPFEIHLKPQEQSQYITMKFNDKNIPCAPDDDQKIENASLHLKIVELFQNRPIWIRNSLNYYLHQHLGRIQTSLIKKYLRKVAYIYKDGPWKYCYVRFGYDPRQDIKAALYQTFEIATETEKSKYANPQFNNYLYLRIFYDPTLSVNPNNYRSRYQFCDINEKNFKILIGKTIQQAEEYNIILVINSQNVKCNKQLGWFRQQIFRDLMKLAKQKLEQLQ